MHEGNDHIEEYLSMDRAYFACFNISSHRRGPTAGPRAIAFLHLLSTITMSTEHRMPLYISSLKEKSASYD